MTDVTGPPRWLDGEEQGAWRAYLRGTRAVAAALDRDLRAVDLSLAEYELLSMLSETTGARMRMSALAEVVVQSRSRVTHAAGRLETRGLVRRLPASDDGRGVFLELTAEGRRVIEAVAPAHVESVRRHLVDVVDRTDFLALGRTMQRTLDVARERAEE